MIWPLEHVILYHAITGIPLHSTQHNSIQLNSAKLTSLQLNSNKLVDHPSGQLWPGSKSIAWSIDPRGSSLSVLDAENLHEIFVYGWDMCSIICRHHRCYCAGSICKHYLIICTRYGVVSRCIQEPGFSTVHLIWAKPHTPVLTLCPGQLVAVIQDPHRWYTLLLQLPLLLPACPSSAWFLSHHQRCFPLSLAAALYNHPLLKRMSKQPAHWPVDRELQELQVFVCMKYSHHQNPPPS